MPWIDDEEDKARQAKWKAEREAKEKPLRASWEKLTNKQRFALMDVYEAINDFRNQTYDLGGDCYHSTWRRVMDIPIGLRQAFPDLDKDDC